jgi:hypothetical protein
MMFKSCLSLFRFPLPAMVGIALLSWCSGAFAGVLPVMGQVSPEQRQICADPIRFHERQAGIPNQLLAAVARAESGRWDKGESASFAWPWTVTAEGKGQFFASKEEAIAQVQRLRGRGVRNIDVGCMQINLLHHPDAFADLEEALDPQANVAYATSFLKQLFEQNHSWVMAVGNYHSATPEFHFRYREKVMKLWSEERRRDAEARRQEVIAAYQQRRQQALAQKEHPREASSENDESTGPDAEKFNIADSRPASSQSTAAIAASRLPLSSSLPSRTPPSQGSFRVMSQIPSGPTAAAGEGAAERMAAPLGVTARQGAPARILPRATAVPLERRF